MKSGIWKLTKLGRKRVGSIYSQESGDSVLSYLSENKTASVEELSNVSGKSVQDVKSVLRKLERQGITEELGGM